MREIYFPHHTRNIFCLTFFRNKILLHLIQNIHSQLFQVAIEAISSIRTVAALGCEGRYVEMFRHQLEDPHNLSMKKSNIRGCIFGFSQSIQFVAWGVILWFGGYLVEEKETNFDAVFM